MPRSRYSSSKGLYWSSDCLVMQVSQLQTHMRAEHIRDIRGGSSHRIGQPFPSLKTYCMRTKPQLAVVGHRCDRLQQEELLESRWRPA
jgi:hypothetical protein